MKLDEFLLTGIDWRVASLFLFSLFCLAVAGFSAQGFSQFVKKIWAYTRLKAHPGLQAGKTWLVWPTTTGSFNVLLEKKGLNAVILSGDGKTIYVPTLVFDGMPKVTVDQQSLADEVPLTRDEHSRIMRVVDDLTTLPEICE